MDGDLFQILFVLVILVASVFDTIARTKRKQSRLPDGGGSSDGDAEERARQRQEALERRRRAIEKRRARETGTARAEAPPPTQAAEPRQMAKPRETADSMVPADLWAVLTGQPAPPTHRTPPTYGDSMDVEPWDETGIEGESAEISIERESVERAPAETIPAHRGRVERLPVETVLLERPPLGPIPPGRAGGRVIEGGHMKVAPLVPSLGPRVKRRRTSGGLLAGGGPDELRKAVVLTEILGQPVALRRSGHPWEER